MRSNEDSSSANATRTLPKIPRSVWALGFVSMFMDISSEMIHALLPLYMVTVLGTSVVAVGVIEGIAEATASISKVFSGALSDRLGKRKLLTVLGYGLGALTKPVFPMASGLEWLTAARFVDRVGKGIRGAPRDALVADVTPPELRGAAFGLRQALDTVGAFLGPLLAIVLMWLTASHFQTVFWVAVLVLMALAYSVSAYPAGVLSDRLGRHGVLMTGLGMLIAADLLLALLPGWTALALGVAAWGLHLGFTQGIFAAMIADSAPANLRGTAFGLFNLLTGVALLAASVVAGLLWDGAGFQATFLVGAGLASTTLVGVMLLR
ncbi:MFS transporter [Pseudomonas sp. SIMBA_067]|uniref:MFS transporter n=1 Tax=Pseudomonas sp. SIMBA_067 TaxID=3085807 RepID=UPI00397D2035